MNRKFKYLIGLVVLAMLAGFTMSACTTGTTTIAPTTGTTKGTTQGPTTTATTSGTTLDTTPITLTIGLLQDELLPGSGVHQDIKNLAIITEKTGVTLEWVAWDEAKLAVLTAGGDLPDMICTGGTVTAVNMMEAGGLLQLDDLLDQYGQNIKTNIPTALKFAKEVIGKGKTYFMPTNVSVANTAYPAKGAGGNVWNARYDVYKAVGSPKISNDDEFLAVLKQMQDYQRTQTGKTNIWALSSWNDWGTWPYIITYPFSNGYSNFNFDLSVTPTGELESNYLNENSIFWQGIEFFNKANRLGILDPEALVLKFDQYSAKATNGELLCVGAAYWQPDPALTSDTAIFTVLPGSTKYISKAYGLENLTGYGPGQARCISVNCKYPARAMQVFNYFDSVEGARMLANGRQGIEWDIVDGVAQLIGDYKQAVLTGKKVDYCNANKLSMDGENAIHFLNNYMSSPAAIALATGEAIALDQTPEMLILSATPQEKNFAKDFGSNLFYKAQVYDLWLKAGTAKTVTGYPLATGLTGAASAESTSTIAKADEYFMANSAKVILAKDATEFATAKAAMIQAFKDMGCEAVEAEGRQKYKDAQALVASF